MNAAQVVKSRALAFGLLLAAFVAASLLAAGPARADTFTVTNTDNTGAGSLRQAILDANDEVNHPGADTISFAIPGTGPHTIAPTSELPGISAPLTIDGYTQADASENTLAEGTNAVLKIELNFANVIISNNIGLDISAGNSTVRGLVINGAPSFPAISLHTKGGNVIEGNFIGTNPTGTAAGPGNNNEGITLGVGSGNNVIGGTTPAARNLISGNASNGVRVGIGNSGEVSQNNRVEGNLIGTDAAGTSAIPNLHGVNVRGPASNNTIGGTTTAARNIISGNTTYGVFLESSPGTVVQGNFIGTDVTGAAAVPNVEAGVHASGSEISVNNVFIGGAAAGAGNVISGNGNADSIVGDGVYLGGSGVAVQGNVIGRNANGAAPLGNRKTGITVAFNGNTIGGVSPGAGNTIASNGFFGVSIREQSIQRIPILSNSIFSNAQLGINLSGNDSAPYGVTLNDPGDGDGFVANQGQNFPEISDASVAGSKATVSGKLNSTGGTTFRLEFFSSAACDPSGYGEGQTFIGSTSVRTESDGNQNFTFTSPDEFEVPAGQSVITSTATDPTNNTSEFSKCVTATGAPPNTAPEATDDPNTPGNLNYATNEGTPLTVSAANGVLANDLDPNSDPLTAVKVSNPANGSVTLNANGSFVYTPNNDFTGTDSFTYKANDGTDDSNTATVTITVNPADTSAPTVANVSPANGASKVRRTTNVTATFSEPMDPNTLSGSTFALLNTKTGASVPASSVTLSPDGKTVTFDPSVAKLAKKTKYEARIKGGSAGAKDLAGNPLAADKVWSFTTGRK